MIRLCIFISIVIHLSATCSLFLLKPKVKNKVIELSVQYIKGSQNKNSKKQTVATSSNRQHGRISKKATSLATLSELIPRQHSSSAIIDEIVSNNRQQNLKSNRYSQQGSLGEFNSMGLSEALAIQPFIQAAWSKIDKNTKYIQEFADVGIKGSVDVDIAIGKDGRFNGEFYNLKGKSKVLKAYVLSVIMNSLSQPLPSKLWLKNKKQLLVSLRFSFTPFYTSEPKSFSRTRHFKNALYFSKYAKVETSIEKAYQKITKYVPPIIPLPGFIYVDFIGVYQWLTHNPDEDPDKALVTKVQKMREMYLEKYKKLNQ